MISFVVDQSIPGVFYLPKKWCISWKCALFIKNYLFFLKNSILLPCKKFTPQIWALSKPHFWNFYRPLPCEPPFERRICRAAAVRAAQRTRRNNRFCHAYIEIYMFFWQSISYSNFKLCCIVNDKCNSRQHYEKSHIDDIVIHTLTLIFTHWHWYSHIDLDIHRLTVFLLYFALILLYLLYFYCISQSYYFIYYIFTVFHYSRLLLPSCHRS